MGSNVLLNTENEVRTEVCVWVNEIEIIKTFINVPIDFVDKYCKLIEDS